MVVVRYGTGMVQIWKWYGTDIEIVWYVDGIWYGLVLGWYRHGNDMVQIWYWHDIDMVWYGIHMI